MSELRAHLNRANELNEDLWDKLDEICRKLDEAKNLTDEQRTALLDMEEPVDEEEAEEYAEENDDIEEDDIEDDDLREE